MVSFGRDFDKPRTLLSSCMTEVWVSIHIIFYTLSYSLICLHLCREYTRCQLMTIGCGDGFIGVMEAYGLCGYDNRISPLHNRKRGKRGGTHKARHIRAWITDSRHRVRRMEHSLFGPEVAYWNWTMTAAGVEKCFGGRM